MEFSPDGKWLYFVAFQGRDIDTSEIYRIDLGNPGATPEHIDQGYAMRISSRGDLAYIHIRGQDDYIPTVLAADGSRHELKPGIGGAAFVWSPDARWLAYSQGYQADQQTYEEYVVDTRTWTQRTYAETLPCNCDSGARPFWSPDSSKFSYVRLTASGPVSVLFDPTTLSMTTAPTNRGWIDSRRYVGSEIQVGNALEFFIYDLASNSRTPLTSPATASPDGGLLATVSSPGAQDIDVSLVALDGTVMASALEGEFYAWSEDSSLVLTRSGTSHCGPYALLVHRASDGVELVCRNVPSSTTGAVISPDSRHLAYFTSAVTAPPSSARVPIGQLYLIEVATGVERVLADDIRGFHQACLKWSPDSRFVVVGACEGV